jgi:hypothetical protein
MSPADPSRRQFVAAAAAFAAAAALTSRSADAAGGRGNVQVQARSPGPFTAVHLRVPADAEVRTGNADGLTIETDAALLPLVETVVVDGALEIRLARGVTEIRPTVLRIVVTARHIDDLAVAGSGALKTEALRTGALHLSVAGTGSITATKLHCEQLHASVAGSGTITLDGEAPRLTASVAGSGDLAAGHLRSESASVNLAGSGSVTVWPAAALTASLVGSGDVRYYGQPKVRASSAGSGSVRRAAGSPSSSARPERLTPPA